MRKLSKFIGAAEVLKLRTAASLTQKGAAALVDVHEVTWQRWELGLVKRVRRSTLDPIVALAAKLAKTKRGA